VLLEAEGPLDELELKGRCAVLLDALGDAGAKIYLPRGDRDYAVHVGLRTLTLRHLVSMSDDGLYAAVASERPLLAYYANAIAHLPRSIPRAA
jgi:glycerol-3-phosphate O-acyltransferase